MFARLVPAVAALLSLSLLWSGPVPQAEAKRPAAPASLATNAIDAHLGYLAQSTCSPSPKPGTTALLKLLIKTWGGKSSGIYRGCSVGGTSEHKEGRALDWRMDMKSKSQRTRVDQALKWLTANNGEVAYRLGVMYIIWNQQIWSIYYPELGWRKMPSRGSYTANHKNHVHISLSWDGAMKQTSWWTGVAITDPINSKCGVNGARACLPTIARTSAVWPYQATVVPATFMPYPWIKPGIGGSPQVGRTLTVVPGTWVPADAALTFQWTADKSPIAGANQPTYVVTTADVGKEIRVVVTATSATGVVTKTSDELAEVYRGRFSNAVPAIVGTIAPGQSVQADLSSWTPAPTKVTYRVQVGRDRGGRGHCARQPEVEGDQRRLAQRSGQHQQRCQHHAGPGRRCGQNGGEAESAGDVPEAEEADQHREPAGGGDDQSGEGGRTVRATGGVVADQQVGEDRRGLPEHVDRDQVVSGDQSDHRRAEGGEEPDHAGLGSVRDEIPAAVDQHQGADTGDDQRQYPLQQAQVKVDGYP